MSTATKAKMGSMPKKAKKLTATDKRSDAGKFAVHLTSLLSSKGISKEDLVRRTGIEDATIRKWLRGDGIPGSFAALKQLADAIGLADYREILPPKV